MSEYESKEVFCTARIFSLLGEQEPKEDHQTISIMEFRKMIDKFKRGTVIFEEGPVDNDSLFCDNNIYKVYSSSRDAGWISFQTSEKNGHLVVVVSDVTDKIMEKLKLEREKLTTSGNLSQIMFDSLHNTAIANDVVKN